MVPPGRRQAVDERLVDMAVVRDQRHGQVGHREHAQQAGEGDQQQQALHHRRRPRERADRMNRAVRARLTHAENPGDELQCAEPCGEPQGSKTDLCNHGVPAALSSSTSCMA